MKTNEYRVIIIWKCQTHHDEYDNYKGIKRYNYVVSEVYGYSKKELSTEYQIKQFIKKCNEFVYEDIFKKQTFGDCLGYKLKVYKLINEEYKLYEICNHLKKSFFNDDISTYKYKYKKDRLFEWRILR